MKLAIHGACFWLVLFPKKEVKTTVPKMKKSGVAPSEPIKVQGNGYIQQYVQQIINHCALHIVDFSFTIETSLENVIFETKSLQCISLGYSSNESSEALMLLQRISFELFCAYLTDASEKRGDSLGWLPLLDPFEYAASIRCISGRHFFDRLAFSLDVVNKLTFGMKLPSKNGTTIHAGTTQICALTRLFELLVSEGSHASLSPCIKNDESDGFMEEHDKAGNNKDVAGTKHELACTSFVMPFPSVKLILPNGSKVCMPSCTLHYCMNGTVCRVEGKEGIMINDCFNFFNLRMLQGGLWILQYHFFHWRN